MKPKDLIFLAIVLALSGGIWFGGHQVGLSRNWTLIIAGMVLLLGVIIWLVLTILALRRSSKIEKGLKAQQASVDAGPGAAMASGGGEAEMQEQFAKYLAALKSSPTGASALGELPWYLVIGAPGSGKTTALQESGLAFSSMGHGIRSIRGVGGTRNCDWWFADNAILLDTAGRYTTQPEDHGEWLKFLDLVRESRGRRALNGIIVTVSVGDLIKGDPSAIAGVVRPIRERIVEVCNRLKLVLPVYVVFSKADLIGGFKDFFAGFNRAQRDQVWGVTLAAGERRPARDLFSERIGGLLTALQARRTVAVAAGSRTPAQLAKLALMPGNFASLQKWFGEFIAELFAPMPLTDQPLFRGFYFTSGIQVSRPGERSAEASPGGASPMPSQEQVDSAKAKDMSVFFLPGADALPPASEAGDTRRGLFLKDLFARVIIPDRHLAGIPAPLLRRARLLRLVAVVGSLALGVLLGALLTSRHISDQRLIARAVSAGTALAADPAGKGAGEAVGALENARAVMAEAIAHGGGTGRSVIERLDPMYGARIAKSFIEPAAAKIGRDLDDLRRAEAKDAATYDRIFDLFRAYQMLGGAILPDRALLERVLIDEGRWFAATGGAAPGESEIRAAKAHLALIEAAGADAKGWQAQINQQLVQRVEDSLSNGALWINQSFADTVASLQSGAPLGRERIIGGPLRDLVEVEAGVPNLFTPEGWSGIWQPAMDEKAAALRTRYAGIRIDRTVDDIRGQLRKMYGREYNSRWLKLIAGVRPAAFADLAQASTRLRQFAGEDSPYRTLVKNTAEFARIEFGDPDVRVLVPTDGLWVDEGLKAMVELQGQIEKFLQATNAGSRGKDAVRLAELCAAADKTKAAFEAAAGKLENEQVRTAATTCLMNVLEAVHRAIAADLGSEVDRAWAAEVVKPYTEQLAGKYPFDPKSAIDAPLPVVAKLWNPKNGALWARVAVIENLRQTRFAGRELLPTSLEYQRLLGPARQFRDAFFAGESEDLAVAFTLTLVQRESVKDMSVAVGKQTFGLYDRPNRRYRYEWKNADGGGAKVSLNLATGQWITGDKDFPTPAWGMLRMLRSASSAVRPEGGLSLTWVFPHQGKEFRGGGVLEDTALLPLVTGDGLASLVPPAKISP